MRRLNTAWLKLSFFVSAEPQAVKDHHSRELTASQSTLANSRCSHIELKSGERAGRLKMRIRVADGSPDPRVMSGQVSGHGPAGRVGSDGINFRVWSAPEAGPAGRVRSENLDPCALCNSGANILLRFK